jgi:DNA-binding CsgD family transcriptional regulator
MVRDLLLDIVNKWRISDLIVLLLLIFAFSAVWYSSLILGLKILNIKVKFKRIILGVFLGVFISLFIKPFIPGAFAFFFTLIPLIILIRFYSKTKWLFACWVTFIDLLASSIGPMLLINPISSINHNIGLFLFKSMYGLPIMSLIEALGVVLLLLILNIFDISLAPDPKRPLKSIEFVAVYVFLAIGYGCYCLTIDIWKHPMQFSTWTLINWTIAAGALVAFYIYKIYSQKKDQAKDQEIQRLKEKENKKVDSQDLVDFSDKLHNTLKPPDIDSEFPVYITSMPEIEFTKREQEILQLIAQGYTNKEIAKALFLSVGRVGNIISENLIPKTGLSDRKLAVYAVYWVKKNKK